MKAIMKWVQREMRYETVDWIQLAQGRNQWQALVHMVMKL
jgi:hypothetical protein